MTKFKTTEQAYEAFRHGEANLDDVERAIDRSIALYFERTGKTPTPVMSPQTSCRIE